MINENLTLHIKVYILHINIEKPICPLFRKSVSLFSEYISCFVKKPLQILHLLDVINTS